MKNIPTTQGTDSIRGHGSRTQGVTPPDVCTPRTLLIASGALRADSSRGKTTLKASAAQAPLGKYRACGCHPRHLACRRLYFHLLGIPELCPCEAWAEFPVMLISSSLVAISWARSTSRISENALPSCPLCLLAQPLRARCTFKTAVSKASPLPQQALGEAGRAGQASRKGIGGLGLPSGCPTRG